MFPLDSVSLNLYRKSKSVPADLMNFASVLFWCCVIHWKMIKYYKEVVNTFAIQIFNLDSILATG